MRHLLILTCLLFGTGAMADEADFDFKSKKANIAIEKYQATIKKAKAVEKRNRVDLILALEAALKYERTEGELDEAIKIRDAIKALKKASPVGASAAGSTGRKSKARIPRDAVKWNGHHYLLSDINRTPAEAKERCESADGHLVRIENAREQEFVARLASKGFHSYYWIDGSDRQKEGTWIFSDGTPMSYFNWGPGEPSKHPGENYLIIIPEGDWRGWHDVIYTWNRNEPSGFICEWDE